MVERDQALFNRASLLSVDGTRIAELKTRALTSPTRRFRLCLHATPEDAVQEMIVVHCRDNYSRPHTHPVAVSILLLEGALDILLFDDEGNVAERIELRPFGQDRPFVAHLKPGRWYMPVCRSPQAVFYEAKAGPFCPDETNRWAPWSPAEDDPAGIANYRRTLGLSELP